MLLSEPPVSRTDAWTFIAAEKMRETNRATAAGICSAAVLFAYYVLQYTCTSTCCHQLRKAVLVSMRHKSSSLAKVHTYPCKPFSHAGHVMSHCSEHLAVLKTATQAPDAGTWMQHGSGVRIPELQQRWHPGASPSEPPLHRR